jgi:hypothetical protein
MSKSAGAEDDFVIGEGDEEGWVKIVGLEIDVEGKEKAKNKMGNNEASARAPTQLDAARREPRAVEELDGLDAMEDAEEDGDDWGDISLKSRTNINKANDNARSQEEGVADEEGSFDSGNEVLSGFEERVDAPKQPKAKQPKSQPVDFNDPSTGRFRKQSDSKDMVRRSVPSWSSNSIPFNLFFS